MNINVDTEKWHPVNVKVMPDCPHRIVRLDNRLDIDFDDYKREMTCLVFQNTDEFSQAWIYHTWSDSGTKYYWILYLHDAENPSDKDINIAIELSEDTLHDKKWEFIII
tara:strand:- start:611 stop:937 length:327 start_codon:yes stop_codon:yes gene_type:complete